MENIRETGELVFTTSLDRTRTVRIPNPSVNLTQSVVSAAVNRILLANPFDETVGDLKALKSADRVTVSRVVLLPVE